MLMLLIAMDMCYGSKNQMLDYGFNVMNTKIYIDNESTICIVKNPVFHSKTKHIEIRHHFIRDSYEKKLIQVIKIHTDQNVADILTKAFDASSGPRCQDTILGDVDAQTRFETTSKQYNDPPLSKVNTFGSGEDSMKLMELMTHCTKLSALSSPKFAETHNVVAFLEKPIESDGFAEIIDFLKASSIHYALTVNPVIYTSCIKQFWATAKVKKANGAHQLQVLIDKKNMIITESSIRSNLHLDDAEGTDCLPTITIFEELAKMGYEKPSQKLTFYKAFFSPQWKFFIHTITQSLIAKSTA
ncbi:hypothetical protein Tco_1445566 [Tanacetum coccineum]